MKKHAKYIEESDGSRPRNNQITILFLAANPQNTTQLRLDEEAREIYRRIRLANRRDNLRFITWWAVQPSDILQAVNETHPTIIHFSGHGIDTGKLVLENQNGTPIFVSPEAISQAISTVSDYVKLVVFNVCFSVAQAESITKCIKASIGMSTSISDEAACAFAAQFYSSIGFGLSLNKAFEQARAGILLEGINESDTPKLFCNNNVNADDLYFA